MSEWILSYQKFDNMVGMHQASVLSLFHLCNFFVDVHVTAGAIG